MSGWVLGCWIAVASLVMVFFTYRGCMTIIEIEEVLPRWAKQHGFRIIRQEAPIFHQGPFPRNQYRPVYFVTVEDQQQRQKSGWVRLGWWYVVGFKENVEVRWGD